MAASTDIASKLRTGLCVLMACLSGIPAYAGGGWTPAKGKGYFKLSQYIIKADEHYTDTGQKDPNITIGYFSTNLYGEVGLTDRWAVIFNLPVFARNLHNNQVSNTTGDVLIQGEAINGIGDIDLSVKYGIVQHKKVAFAGTFQLGIPSGKTGKGELGILQLGDGECNQLFRFDVSNPFMAKESPMYTNVYVGFNNRTKGYSEEFRWGAEIGVGLFNEHLWLNGKLDGITSLKNGEQTAGNNSTSLFANNAEYISYSFEAAGKFYKGLGISFNYSSTFHAKIIFAAPSYTVGVFYDLK